jgi:hypothetical protein
MRSCNSISFSSIFPSALAISQVIDSKSLRLINIFSCFLSYVRIYANEGVVQLLFFEGESCETTYADRSGKYHNQGSGVT